MVDRLLEEPLRGLSLLKKRYGSKATNKEIALALTEVGHTYTDVAIPHLALPYFKEALKMSICSEGREASKSIFVAEAYSNVGAVLTELNSYQSATEHLGNALRVYQAAQRCNLQELNDEIARMYNLIGVLMRKKCQFKASHSFHVKALALLHLEHGTEIIAQDELAITYKNLGELFMAQCQFRKAVNNFVTSIKYFLELANIPSGFPLHHLPDIMEVYTKLSRVYSKLIHYEEAQDMLEQVVEVINELIEGENHWVRACVQSCSGELCQDRGLMAAAQMSYEDAKDMLASYYGSEECSFPKLAEANILLADISASICDIDAAENYYIQALAIMEDIYGNCSTNLDIAKVHNCLGSFYLQIGNFNKALVHHDKAMTILKTTLGKNGKHTHIADTYDLIGKVYTELGDYATSCGYHSKSYDMNIDLYDNELSEALVENYINKGNAHLGKGNCKYALEIYTKAKEAMKPLYEGINPHPVYIKIHVKLAAVKRRQRCYDASNKECDKALSIVSAVYASKENINAARIYMCQGDLKFSYENYYDAQVSYTRAADIVNDVVSKNYHSHSDLARIITAIGRTYHMQYNFEKAIEEYDRAARILIRIGLNNNPEMALIHSYTGDAYAGAGNLTSALNMYLKALKIREKVYSEFRHRIDIAENLHDVGVSYYNIGLHNDALSYLADAVVCKQRIYGYEPHIAVALSYDAIGDVHHSKGDFIKALKYYKRSVKMRQDIHCNNYQCIDVADGYRLLAKAHTGLKEYKCALELQNKSLEIYKWVIYDPIAVAKYAECLEEMACTLGEQGEWYQARARLQEAFEVGKTAAEKLKQKFFENEKCDYYDLSPELLATVYAKAVLKHHKIITTQIKARVHFKLGRAYFLDSMRLVYAGLNRNIRCNKLKEALCQLKESLCLLLTIHGSDCNHIDLADTHGYLGRVYLQMSMEALHNDNYDSAMNHLHESLIMRKELFSINLSRVDIAVGHSEIGHIHCLRKEYVEGKEHCRLAFEMLKNIYGECSDRLEMAHVHENMGLIYRDQKDFKTALQQFKIAYNIKCKIYGHFLKFNAELANINAYLADVYRCLGNKGCSLKHHAIVNKITYPSAKEE